eukprot:TRINITY_DN53977_c0_g1_i1.p1 TRINITY_DN53977_c0_g1~~TRINITY_DN53977_c0_g1_i1.p1  ORF type:complete len:378 (-),score=63.64 TRINITY_DN53977_c0_g1_i1:136-1182(-)
MTARGSGDVAVLPPVDLAAPRVRWADVADDSPREFAPASRTSCRQAEEQSQSESEAEGDCSTRAPSECGTEGARDRLASLADVASGDEQPSGGAASAAASPVSGRASRKGSREQQATSSSRAHASTWDATPSTTAWSSSACAAADCWEEHKAAPAKWRAKGGAGKDAWSSSSASSWDRRSRRDTDPSSSSSSSSSWWQASEYRGGGGGGGRRERGGTSASNSWWSAGGRAARKLQCQFDVGIEEDAVFGVVRKLLGPHGRHVKRIAETSGAKLRLRGRGSGFLEGYEQKESSDPLMLCVSSQDAHGYETAKRLVTEHLEEIYAQYSRSHPRKAVPRVKLHEGPREGSF